MARKKYLIRAVLLDLDSIIVHLGRDFFVSGTKESNIVSSLNDSILYPPSLDSFVWNNEIIDEVGSFLFSLIRLNLPFGIVSTGNMIFVRWLIDLWDNVDESDFGVIISNEDILPTTLFPEQDLDVLIRGLGVPNCDILIVGSSSFYTNFKLFFGMLNLCLANFVNGSELNDLRYDFVVNKLCDIVSVIEKGVLFPAGKLPNSVLRDLLSKYKFKDSSVIVGPSVGEDTAAVDISEHEVIVLKSDPVTFATDNIGYYSVLVNSNDMATSGTIPKWMLTTLMFPPGVSLYDIQKIFKELYETCCNQNIVLCGGHTEITDAVSRPIIVGTMIGTIKRANLINKKNVRPGDLIVMTKSLAIEGTAIIASEFREMLLKNGISLSYLDECLELRSKVSILPEAKIAWKNVSVSALHDVTEGGISTAITELSESTGYGISVHLDDILVSKQTKILCKLLNINALGLIGSGSLLICCHQNGVDSLLSDMKLRNIQATVIGKITGKGGGVEAISRKLKCQFPCFEVDEITSLFN